MVTSKVEVENAIGAKQSGSEAQAKGRRSLALWLGGVKGSLEMGWGRGPRRLEPHELVSWFFSRDGI